MVDKNKKVWPDKQHEALWAYKTTYKPLPIHVSLSRRSNPTPRSATYLSKGCHHKSITKDTNIARNLRWEQTCFLALYKAFRTKDVELIQQIHWALFISKGYFVLVVQSPMITGKRKRDLERFRKGHSWSKKSSRLEHTFWQLWRGTRWFPQPMRTEKITLSKISSTKLEQKKRTLGITKRGERGDTTGDHENKLLYGFFSDRGKVERRIFLYGSRDMVI